jgi:hypothetical protein
LNIGWDLPATIGGGFFGGTIPQKLKNDLAVAEYAWTIERIWASSRLMLPLNTVIALPVSFSLSLLLVGLAPSRHEIGIFRTVYCVIGPVYF